MSELVRLRWHPANAPGVLHAIEPTVADIELHAAQLAVAYNDPHNAALMGNTEAMTAADVVAHYSGMNASGARQFHLFVDDDLVGDADLRDIEQGGNARQQVFAEGGGRGQDVAVAGGVGDDQGAEVFGGLGLVVGGVGDFDDAVLERQKLANLFAGFLERPASGQDAALDPLTGLPIKTDSDGTPMAALEPGTMQELLPGETVKFSEPPDAGAGYRDFTRQQYQGVAAGGGLPYELLTGDLSGVSDRALRVILNEFRRHCQQRQWHILIPQFCRKVRNAWADAAILAGILTGAEGAEARRVTWVPQGWAYIHPTQDVQAQQMAEESGFTSRTRIITERGDDPEEIDAERAADEAREAELGLAEEAGHSDPAPDPLAEAVLAGQQQLGDTLAALASREIPAPQLTVHMPGPGKPTMKVGRRLADGSIEVREVEIEEAPNAD